MLDKCVARLKELKTSIWWIHEDVLLDVLDVEYEYDTVNQNKKFICLLIKLLKKGKLIAKVDGIDMTLNSERLLFIEDHNIDNVYDFWMQEYQSNGSTKRIKWFKKGKPSLSLKYQLHVLNFAIGHHNSIYPSSQDKERKQRTYQGWYHGKKLDSIVYKNNILEQVIISFPEVFRDTYNYSNLLKQCFFYSNAITMHTIPLHSQQLVTNHDDSSQQFIPLEHKQQNCSPLRKAKSSVPNALTVTSLVGDRSMKSIHELYYTKPVGYIAESSRY